MKYEKINMAVDGQKAGEAELTIHLLDPVSVSPDKKRPMVIVVPGGGYERCSDRESEPVAMKFLAMGCHACILDYSVSPNRFPVALRELALAIATIRDHAEEWYVDEKSVLVCGFSAGGHLACSMGAFWNRPVSYEGIGRNARDVRPDGLILCYPVITSGEDCHPGSFEASFGEGDLAGDKKGRILGAACDGADAAGVFVAYGDGRHGAGGKQPSLRPGPYPGGGGL